MDCDLILNQWHLDINLLEIKMSCLKKNIKSIYVTYSNWHLNVSCHCVTEPASPTHPCT